MALWTVALFAALEGLTGQVIEPVFEGRTTGLTPVAIILAATFWAWIWGPIGLVLATPLTVILVVLGRHVEGLKFFDILLGDQPALSESEALYQRILAHDPIEAVEHAKAFMTAHSLSQYCDRVVKPALQLARKDADRGALEGEVLERFHKTFESLFADIAHEHWILRREKRADKDGRPGSLPMVHADQLTGRWTSAAPFVSIGCHDCLDEAAATVIATLAQTHGLPARVEKPQSLTAAELDKLDLSGAALICVSCLDLRTPARIQYAVRRVRTKAPDAKLMLGLWTATDEAVLGRPQASRQRRLCGRHFPRSRRLGHRGGDRQSLRRAPTPARARPQRTGRRSGRRSWSAAPRNELVLMFRRIASDQGCPGSAFPSPLWGRVREGGRAALNR